MRMMKSDRKIRASATSKKKRPYQSWQMPFSGLDKKNDLMFKLDYLKKGLGFYFGVKL